MCHSLAELTEVSGTGMEVLQNLQKFRVRAWTSYITHRSSGYGHGSLTELAEVPVMDMEVLQITVSCAYGYGSPTEFTEVPGRYTNVVPVPQV